MQSLRDVLVTDRTEQDVRSRNGKGTYNAEDLNRVLRAVSYLAGRLDGYGYAVSFYYFPACLLTAKAKPPGGGRVTGDLRYKGEEAVVKAVPVGGFKFLRWEEAGEAVSTDPAYHFTAERSRELTAVFAAPDDAGNGIIGVGRIGEAKIEGGD